MRKSNKKTMGSFRSSNTKKTITKLALPTVNFKSAFSAATS